MSFLGLFRQGEPPENRSDAPEQASATDPAAVTSRRERAANAGSVMMMEALSQKLMHGWLQNRHQTLVPLTLNLRVLSDQQRALVAGAAAALLLAGRPREDALIAAPALSAWLREVGADPASTAAYDHALREPPTLDAIMERALALDVPAYIYMTGLTAADPRFPASALLCNVLQARFELPTAVVRSIVRRHRR